ncbi:MAG: hypothetical protein PHT44_04260 [Candidatus Portnoybacteria bacterium]|nr:hypothetical protein [Candidatus Portnoybacteria bacterium]MDD4983123.1 hypothetical protein [Candidatus Portnoybacteria bacterium]
MAVILFGKPLAFWLGFITLAVFCLQLYSGIRMAKGRIELLKYHKINAVILSLLVLTHMFFAISLHL